MVTALSYITIAILLLNYILHYPVKNYAISRIYILKFNYRILFFLLFATVINTLSINSHYLDYYTARETMLPYKYNWTNILDVIQFPFDQLDANNSKISAPDFEKEKEIKNLNFIFLLDFTGSTENLMNSPKEIKLKDITEKMSEKLTKTSDCDQDNILQNFLNNPENFKNSFILDNIYAFP